ncbi:unnamed protein product [Eruca vesicaria subsp. sativa]|uniref:Large ribosomal subunit protein uL24 C-terminal domain-containing protein n=1 Tax=Eruca vesicaria subsp. sativa TaxID=29727 RepID=A0ABC8L428_ERUVS|nr:unnamed protein product [Eruca vesicaria subsp. sativa]
MCFKFNPNIKPSHKAPSHNPCLVFAKLYLDETRAKIGEVTKIFTHNSTIVIKDVNLKTKDMKSREEGEHGQILKIKAQIHSSNVMLYSKEKEVVSRVGQKVLEGGQKVRYLIKTGELIDTIEQWIKKQLKFSVASIS